MTDETTTSTLNTIYGINYQSAVPTPTNTIIVDGLRPTVSNIQIVSSNVPPAFAVLNDTVTLTFDVNETVTGVTVDDVQFYYTNGGLTTTVWMPTALVCWARVPWKQFTLVSTDPAVSGGYVSWDINTAGFTDLAGIPPLIQTITLYDYTDFDSDTVTYDFTPPNLRLCEHLFRWRVFKF